MDDQRYKDLRFFCIHTMLRAHPEPCLLAWFLIFFFSFKSFWLFRATPAVYGGSQARGPIRGVAASLHHSHSNPRSKLCLWPTPQLTGNAGSVTHWARPGIEPAASWFLVRAVSVAPRGELWKFSVKCFHLPLNWGTSLCIVGMIENKADCFFSFLLFFSFFFFFLGLHLWHIEVPRLGVDLHHSHSTARSQLCLQPTPQLVLKWTGRF